MFMRVWAGLGIRYDQGQASDLKRKERSGLEEVRNLCFKRER